MGESPRYSLQLSPTLAPHLIASAVTLQCPKVLTRTSTYPTQDLLQVLFVYHITLLSLF